MRKTKQVKKVQVLIRTTPATHKKLTKAAKAEKRSVSAQAAIYIEQALNHGTSPTA